METITNVHEEKWNALFLAFLQGIPCHYKGHAVYINALHPYHGYAEVIPSRGKVIEVSDIERIVVSQTK